MGELLLDFIPPLLIAVTIFTGYYYGIKCWSVVMFLNGLSDLERIENEMNLKRIYYANYGRGKDS